MTLTHQFLITLALPVAFLLLSLYTWRLCRTRLYGPYWSLTMLAAALWASSLLSYYSGVALAAEVALSWRIAALHLFTACAVLVLLTTTAFLSTPRPHRRLLLGISAIFWSLALVLDPTIWPNGVMGLAGNTQASSHFYLWSAVWVTAWLLPLLAAMMLTREALRGALSTLYRNRLNYWFTALFLFTLSGIIALIQEPGQPAWQELGGLGMLLAAFLGTRTLMYSSLTNLRLALRHVVARLTASLLILTLTWLFLFLIVSNMPVQVRNSTVLEFGLFAAVFTVLISAVNRYVPLLVRRLLLRNAQYRGVLADQPALTTALPDPSALGKTLLRLAQFNIAAESARLLLVEDQDGPDICLRQVASVGEVEEDETIKIEANSSILTHFRRRPPQPLSTYELDTLPEFAEITSEEKDRLRRGAIELFMPLGAGDELVGVLALGEKFSGESYEHDELAWLQDIAAHGGLLLWQAKELQRNMTRLEVMREEMGGLQRELVSLRELLVLHDRFTQMISPALRQPFSDIHHTLDALQKEDATNGAAPFISELNGQLAQLRLMLDNLIVNANRVRRQHNLSFAEVDMAEIIERAVGDLQAISSARRVSVNISSSTRLPSFDGDRLRLYEAIQHLIHNAIRFNKIGGCVDIQYGINREAFYLHVRDDGPGISEEQLQKIWHDELVTSNNSKATIGAGLSLAMTRFIIRAHGGRLEVDSVPDGGSTFSIYLPLADANTYSPAAVS